MESCNQSQYLMTALAMLAYSVLEYWLGKTCRTKSASVLEILFRALGTASLALTLWIMILKGKSDGRKQD